MIFQFNTVKEQDFVCVCVKEISVRRKKKDGGEQKRH